MSDFTSVYIARGARKRVLYVGIAKSWAHRWVQHARGNQGLVDEIKTLSIRTYSSRNQAEAVEAGLILRFRPKYNVRGLSGLCRDLRCDYCGCWYAEGFRSVGDRCNDMSHALSQGRADWTRRALRRIACRGIVRLAAPDGEK
jgi:hypothetical protein